MVEAIYYAWWFWAIIVVLLLAFETMAPAFYFLGMAIGAAVVALMLFIIGAQVFGSSLAMLILGFAVMSLASTIVLRYIFKPSNKQVKNFDHDINE